MRNTTRLLQRHDQTMSQRRVLFVDADDRALFQLRCGTRSIHSDRVEVAADQFAPWPRVPAGTDLVVILLPRARPRLEMLLAALAADIEAPLECWVAGAGREGIRGAARSLARFAGDVTQRDSARHCKLYSGRLLPSGTVFRPEAFMRSCTLEDMEFMTLPGVFSHGRLDAGTALLVEALRQRPPSGRVLDLGCGSGVLSAWLASQGARVTAVDNSATALWCTRHNLEQAAVEAEVHASDGFSAVKGSFDSLCTNPPFHEGAQHNPELTREFLRQAPTHLVPGGQLIMVANRGLPYADVLQDSFARVETVKENRHFRVWRAVKGRSR